MAYKWPLSRKISFKENIFYQNIIAFLPTYKSILNPCYDGNVHVYASTKELKKNAFTITNQNKNQEIGIKVTFILRIKFQKYIISKIWPCLQSLMCPFWHPVRMGKCIRMPQPKNWKGSHLRWKVKIKNKRLLYKWPSC